MDSTIVIQDTVTGANLKMNDICVNGPTSDWTEKDWDKFRDWLKGMLKVTEMTVTFNKKDGSERVMHCTLQPEILPKVEVTEEKKPRKTNEGTMAVFDIDAQAWRSFSLKSITRVEITIG